MRTDIWRCSLNARMPWYMHIHTNTRHEQAHNMNTRTEVRSRVQNTRNELSPEKVQRPGGRKGLDGAEHDGKMALRWRDNRP